MKQLDMFKKRTASGKVISPADWRGIRRGFKSGRVVIPQATSLAAYRSLENISILQQFILSVLDPVGMTDRELVSYFPGESESSVRTRRSELVKLGKVKDSGKREKLPSGRMAIVWELV